MFMTHEGGIAYPTDESSGLLYDFSGFGYDLRMRPAVRLPLYVGLGAEAARRRTPAGFQCSHALRTRSRRRPSVTPSSG